MGQLIFTNCTPGYPTQLRLQQMIARSLYKLIACNDTSSSSGLPRGHPRPINPGPAGPCSSQTPTAKDKHDSPAPAGTTLTPDHGTSPHRLRSQSPVTTQLP